VSTGKRMELGVMSTTVGPAARIAARSVRRVDETFPGPLPAHVVGRQRLVAANRLGDHAPGVRMSPKSAALGRRASLGIAHQPEQAELGLLALGDLVVLGRR